MPFEKCYYLQYLPHCTFHSVKQVLFFICTQVFNIHTKVLGENNNNETFECQQGGMDFFQSQLNFFDTFLSFKNFLISKLQKLEFDLGGKALSSADSIEIVVKDSEKIGKDR